MRRMIVLCACAIGVLASMLAVSPSASAYAKIGCKWNHSTIRYYVPSPLLSYPAWRNGAASWSGQQATLLYNTSSAADDVTGTNENRGNTVAWTGITRTKGTVQTSPPAGGACVNGLYKTGKVEVVINWSYVGKYTSARQRMVAAHEFGHVFGLAHVTNRNVLMYPSDDRTVTTPQSDDKAGVNAIY